MTLEPVISWRLAYHSDAMPLDVVGQAAALGVEPLNNTQLDASPDWPDDELSNQLI